VGGELAANKAGPGGYADLCQPALFRSRTRFEADDDLPNIGVVPLLAEFILISLGLASGVERCLLCVHCGQAGRLIGLRFGLWRPRPAFIGSQKLDLGVGIGAWNKRDAAPPCWSVFRRQRRPLRLPAAHKQGRKRKDGKTTSLEIGGGRMTGG